MAKPGLGVPTQFVGNRKVARGDIVFAEISAAFWEHPGQVLRSRRSSSGFTRMQSNRGESSFMSPLCERGTLRRKT